MPDWVDEIWKWLGDHSGPLQGLGVVLVLIGLAFFPVRLWWSRRQPPQKVTVANFDALAALVQPAPATTEQFDAFTKIQERALEQAKKQLAAAHGEERKRLEDKIDTLNARLRDPGEALAQQQAIIANLEAQLARRGNEIGGDDLAAATAALEAGDFTAARKLFETLAARTAPEVTANADAEFALGQIAEAEIRWHDAARHYATAARLNPVFQTLLKASEFVQRAGDYAAALRFSAQLVDTARANGMQNELSDALNEHGINQR